MENSSQLTDEEQRVITASKMGLIEFRVDVYNLVWYIGDRNITQIYVDLVLKGIHLHASHKMIQIKE